MSKLRYQDLPQFTRSANYCVTSPWRYLLETVAKHMDEWKLDIDPDFQRAHVWTPEQQIAYVEFVLAGGRSGRDLYFNCPGWSKGRVGNYVIVDGKQRLTAVMAYLDNKVPIFGGIYARDFENKPLNDAYFNWHINDLKTRAEVLAWYLEFNAGGTPHTPEELNRVRALLAAEK